MLKWASACPILEINTLFYNIFKSDPSYLWAFCRQLTQRLNCLIQRINKVFYSGFFALLPHSLYSSWLLGENHSAGHNSPPHVTTTDVPSLGGENTALLLSKGPKTGGGVSDSKFKNCSFIDSHYPQKPSWNFRTKTNTKRSKLITAKNLKREIIGE